MQTAFSKSTSFYSTWIMQELRIRNRDRGTTSMAFCTVLKKFLFASLLVLNPLLGSNIWPLSFLNQEIVLQPDANRVSIEHSIHASIYPTNANRVCSVYVWTLIERMAICCQDEFERNMGQRDLRDYPYTTFHDIKRNAIEMIKGLQATLAKLISIKNRIKKSFNSDEK